MAILLASASAVASVEGVPGNVAGKSRRAFLHKVPGFGRPLRSSQATAVGGSNFEGVAQDSNATVVESQAASNLTHAENPTATETIAQAELVETNEPGLWPCMDDLDRMLIRISLPVIANFAIAPVVQAVDLLFLNRLGNALAVAGQAAANQVYGSVFWLTSFIPSSECLKHTG